MSFSVTSPGHKLPNSHTQSPRIFLILRSLPLCRLSALRRDVWSCLAETTVTVWSKMWMGISAATTPSTSCSWSMKVLRRRRTREHHMTRVGLSGETLTTHPQTWELCGWADLLSPGVKPNPHLCLLQGLIGKIGKAAWCRMGVGSHSPGLPFHSHSTAAHCPKTVDFTPHLSEPVSFFKGMWMGGVLCQHAYKPDWGPESDCLSWHAGCLICWLGN